ncbi:hypothetical protein Bbelb_025130 [Branchiostoma belcheri]|nr:hypothetical protein Bbelb_025130 [Branchiostoma belcheri]
MAVRVRVPPINQSIVSASGSQGHKNSGAGRLQEARHGKARLEQASNSCGKHRECYCRRPDNQDICLQNLCYQTTAETYGLFHRIVKLKPTAVPDVHAFDERPTESGASSAVSGPPTAFEKRRRQQAPINTGTTNGCMRAELSFQLSASLVTQSHPHHGLPPSPLYMDAHYNIPYASLSRPTSASSASSSLKSALRHSPGYCFRFHKANGQCRRVSCPFKHECFRCDGRHKVTLCDSKSPSGSAVSRKRKDP